MMKQGFTFDEVGYHDATVLAFEQRATVLHLGLQDVQSKNRELLAVTMDFIGVASPTIDGTPIRLMLAEAKYGNVLDLIAEDSKFCLWVEWVNFNPRTTSTREYRFISDSVSIQATSPLLKDIDLRGADVVGIDQVEDSLFLRCGNVVVEGDHRSVCVEFSRAVIWDIDGQQLKIVIADAGTGKLTQIAENNGVADFTIEWPAARKGHLVTTQYRITYDWFHVDVY